jgi:GT2 family glycosyltransferase
MCVNSIIKNTPAGSYEIIVVNNGSTDGTNAWLKGKKIRTITNKKNMGVAKAWNAGIRASEAVYCCIINNDVVVTGGWLEALTGFYDGKAGAGIVCPGTREGALEYGADAYGLEYTARMKTTASRGLFGWCMLIKKEMFKRAGYFDEAFGIGIGEDTDFYMRLKKAGFDSWITGSAFIHHFGSKTINKAKEDIGNEFIIKNIDVLKKRWGHGMEPYIIRKWKSAYRRLGNLFIKITRGHTLLEKS